MKNVAATINDISAAVVAVIKGLIVAFVFANILYTTGMDPIGGIVSLVDAFLGGGLLGLLALLVFASFIKLHTNNIWGESHGSPNIIIFNIRRFE